MADHIRAAFASATLTDVLAGLATALVLGLVHVGLLALYDWRSHD